MISIIEEPDNVLLQFKNINEFVSTIHVIFPTSLALLFKGCQVVLIPDALTRKEEGGKN